MPKVSNHTVSDEVNGRMYLDLAKIKRPKNMKVTLTKPNWQLIVDEKTGMKFSQFFATKNGMVQPTCEKFNIWKQKGRPVKVLQMDNGGEYTTER